ncbi:MAG: HD domain-containing protein, partial [Anaerotignum sp.]|nr:HD domain-containing protein [Anaerotignum sp.]
DQRAELHSLFEEFEAGETPEAKFARTMDNLQPLLLNNSNDGGDWREHQVTKKQIMGRHARNQVGSEVIGKYTKELIEENIRKGNIRDE